LGNISTHNFLDYEKIYSPYFYNLLNGLSSNSFAYKIWMDFENPSFPPTGWTTNGSNSYLNVDWTLRCSGYGLGLGCMKMNFSDAPAGVTYNLISPNFAPTVSGDSLCFDHAYTYYSSYIDQMKVFYSTDGGTTWTELVTLTGGSGGTLTTAPATATPFVPTTSQWATKKYALPSGTNKIKFNGISGYGNNLYVDNVKIGAPENPDVGATGFARYQKAFTPGTIDTPKVYVRNFGTAAQSFPVTLTITPGTYSQTVNVTNIAPGEIQLITFPAFPASNTGAYTYKAVSGLSSDVNKTNDTIYNTYYVTTNPRNVVIEYATGTWCQWCPCGKVAIHDLEGFFPNLVVLAYHGGSDTWVSFNGNNIISLLGIPGYPTGTYERKIDPNYFSSNGFFELPLMRFLNSPVSPVKIDIITQNYNSTTGLLNVVLNTTALTDLTGSYKITYVISEDNLVYTQTGNSYCTGGSNYVHRWVVRNIVNGATGEALNSGTSWNNGQVISKSFSTTINSAWVAANCKLKVFVYKDGSPLSSNAEIQQAIQTSILLTGIEPVGTNLPEKFELGQNYPNPFNPTTNIKFSVPKDGFVSLKIYDMTGRLVDTYLEDFVQAGYYNADINASKYASGVYFYTLTGNGFKESKRMVVLK
jgi:hypothetical protein